MPAQMPDRIILAGLYWDLYSNPLESYWVVNQKRRPDFCPLPNCTRGYVAKWELKDNQLFLLDVDGNYFKKSFLGGTTMQRYSKYTLFPKLDTRKVKAEWYSGKLRIPQGRMTMYEHQGYQSKFEKDIIMTFEKGNLMKMVTLDYNSKSVLVHVNVQVRKAVPKAKPIPYPSRSRVIR